MTVLVPDDGLLESRGRRCQGYVWPVALESGCPAAQLAFCGKEQMLSTSIVYKTVIPHLKLNAQIFNGVK